MEKPNIVEINTKERQTGKAAVRNLRAESYVPAVVYGPKVAENLNVSLKEVDLEKILSRASTQIVKLEIEGKDTYDVLVKRVEYDKVTDRPIHAELYAMDEAYPVIITVPVRLKGTPRGVADAGGRLYQPVRRIRIQCLPSKLPSEFTLDVSKLRVGDSVNVEDLVMEGITPLRELHRTIAVIRPPKGSVAEQLGYDDEEEEVEGEEAEGAAEGEEAAGEEGGGEEEASAEGESSET